jgi:hypothetical protein
VPRLNDEAGAAGTVGEVVAGGIAVDGDPSAGADAPRGDAVGRERSCTTMVAPASGSVEAEELADAEAAEGVDGPPGGWPSLRVLTSLDLLGHQSTSGRVV